LCGAVLVGALAVGGCRSSVPPPVPPGPPASATVRLQDVLFHPDRVVIHTGQTVRWVWDDAPILHNVTFAHFRSPTQSTGSWSHTFTAPGVYPYRCSIHFDMTGTVVVES
jgi:plastocyanin